VTKLVLDRKDPREELEATIRRVKLLLIEAKVSPSAGTRRRCLDVICVELKKFLAGA
jgi:hypothetical protein